MQTYEIAYIISGQANEQESAAAKTHIESFIQNNGGIILKSDKLRAQPLAYPVNKQRSGYVSVLEFQAEGSLANELTKAVVKTPAIIRHVLAIKKKVRAVKERRIWKSKSIPETSVAEGTPTAKTEPISEADLEKKIDEILGE